MSIIKNGKKLSLIGTMILGFACSIFISCNSTKGSKIEQIYNKPIHPREYYFDIVENGEKQYFRKDKDKENNQFECLIDFTDFVKDDLPQAGDKLIFLYKGYPYKDINGNILASIVMPEENESNKDSSAEEYDEINANPEHIFASNLKENQFFEGEVSFVLDKNLNELKLKLRFNDNTEKKSKIYFKYERVIKSTDATDEKKAEAKAVKKGYQINEVKVDIVNDYLKPLIKSEETSDSKENEILEDKPVETEVPVISVVPEKSQEEIAAEEEEKRIQEEKKQAEEQAKLELEKKLAAEKAERERQEKERQEQQDLLEKTIDEITNTNIKRYEKEYLNDYAVDEYTFDMDNEDYSAESILPNPDEADSFGKTILMKAAQEGNDWQLNALLKAKANVNLTDKDGWTALMYAVRYQANLDCVNLLLDYGADVKAKNNFGMSALVLAANYNNNPEILKKLLTYYKPTDKDVLKSFISVLTENQDSEYMQIIKVNLFLDMSVPLNSFYQGKTPLMYAAELGSSTNVLKLLMDNNSIPSIRSTEGKTAFDYAKENPKLKHDSIYWSLNSK